MIWLYGVEFYISRSSKAMHFPKFASSSILPINATFASSSTLPINATIYGMQLLLCSMESCAYKHSTRCLRDGTSRLVDTLYLFYSEDRGLSV